MLMPGGLLEHDKLGTRTQVRITSTHTGFRANSKHTFDGPVDRGFDMGGASPVESSETQFDVR